jgi:hypothetical protein
VVRWISNWAPSSLQGQASLVAGYHEGDLVLGEVPLLPTLGLSDKHACATVVTIFGLQALWKGKGYLEKVQFRPVDSWVRE